MELYPNNTQAEFTNVLSEPLDLTNHEIALTEFSYTSSFLNIKENFTALVIKKINLNDNIIKTEYDEIQLEKGYYPTNENFLNYANRILQKKVGKKYGLGPETFEYKPIRQIINVHVPSMIQIELTPIMCEICGFKPNNDEYHVLRNPTDGSRKFEADWPADIHQGLYSLYIYCDLVSHQIVGDVKVPLLRTIGIKPNKVTEQITKTFLDPHYLPVAKNFVDKIQFFIFDDQGRPISFQRGKTLVKLHIRQKAPAYL